MKVLNLNHAWLEWNGYECVICWFLRVAVKKWNKKNPGIHSPSYLFKARQRVKRCKIMINRTYGWCNCEWNNLSHIADELTLWLKHNFIDNHGDFLEVVEVVQCETNYLAILYLHTNAKTRHTTLGLIWRVRARKSTAAAVLKRSRVKVRVWMTQILWLHRNATRSTSWALLAFMDKQQRWKTLYTRTFFTQQVEGTWRGTVCIL